MKPKSRSYSFFIHSLILLLLKISCSSVSTQSIVLPACNSNQNFNYREITVIVEYAERDPQSEYLFSNTTARLELKALKCYNSPGVKTTSIDQYLPQDPSNYNKDPDHFFFPDGYLSTKEGNDSHFYSPEDYCIDSVSSSKINLKICEPSCKGNTPCITKCCHHLQNWDYENYVCSVSASAKLWSPYIYSTPYADKPLNRSSFRPHYKYVALGCENLECLYTRELYMRSEGSSGLNEKTRFKLLEDGSMWYVGGDRKWQLQNDIVCIDGITNYYDEDKGTFIEGRGLESEQVMFFCPVNQAESRSNQTILYMASMYFSSFFLLLTCIVYLLLWDKQNVHGWTVFSLVLSMFFMFIFVATAHLFGILPIAWKTSLNNGPFCWLNALLAHFFFLSTFFWLSTINFDLWLTFRNRNRNLSAITGRSKGFKKFGTYAALSWGSPMIVVSTGLILQRLYPLEDSLVLVPDYGKITCFLAPWAQGWYLHYIISVLLLINLVLMMSTFFSLFQVKKVTGSIRSRSNKADNRNETFFRVVKLSVLMDITWIFEIISWVLSRDYTDVAWYFVIFDIWNFFQSILIFIIFTCKKTVQSQLEQKYPVFKKYFTNCSAFGAVQSNEWSFVQFKYIEQLVKRFLLQFPPSDLDHQDRIRFDINHLLHQVDKKPTTPPYEASRLFQH